MEIYVLYLFPVAARVALTDVWTPALAWRAPLSLLPLLVVLPSSFMARCVRSREREHEMRHAFYALAFTASIATSIRWNVVLDSESDWKDEEGWRLVLVAYLVVGCVTLWWFVLSHVFENRLVPALRTHQGDVAVLPLTLVAIATFAQRVPDAAFQFSRAIIFFVPVVVAWATLHFIAYQGFAESRTTTLDHPGFNHNAYTALLVATVHLTLLEVNASAFFFQLFPASAALLCQVVPRHTNAPCLRPWWRTSVLATGLLLGSGVGWLLWRSFGAVGFGTGIVATVVASLVTPRVAGRRWIVPATLNAALLVCAFLDASVVNEDAGYDDGHGVSASVSDVRALRAWDGVAVTSALLLAYTGVQLLSAPVWEPAPPSVVFASEDNNPQDHAPPYAPSKVLRVLSRVPLPHCFVRGVYDAQTPRRLLDAAPPPHPNCPSRFRGVWWMQGNPFPTDLVVVQGLCWKKREVTDAALSATRWDLRHMTRDATLAGLLHAAFSAVSLSRLDAMRDDNRWIRTCGWTLPVVRLLHATYWIRTVEADEMERLVFATVGGDESSPRRVVWRYRLLRVLRDDGTRTRHHAAYLAACEGRSYF